ncbi:MAG: hypothetical protein OXG72_14715, partial [Acidobacteria bacterium]|nr:hypothetical protein [Acidobacteriota bacterium]
MIAITCASSTAARRNDSTAENDSNGWWTSRSRSWMALKIASPPSSGPRAPGGHQRARRERLVLQLRPVQLRQRAPVAVAHPARRADHDVLFDLEVLDQDVEHPRRHRRLDQQLRQVAVAQLLQRAVHRFEQVVGLVLLDHHVGVADDAEQIRLAHRDARKQARDVQLHHVLEQRERIARRADHRGRNRDEARQHVRQLDAGEARAPGLLDHHRQVHAQVRDERERMPGVERQRGQHRVDVPAVVVLQVVLDRRAVVGRVEDANAVRRQPRPHDVGPAALDVVHHPLGPQANGVELLLGAHPVGRQRLAVGAELAQQRRHPHHEELVQVGRHDREELDPLEQRMALVLGLQQHPLVELQPAQLPVDVQRRVLQVRGVRSRVAARRTRRR